ncbi:hypothetical protein ACJZ2D_001321 [Fusarium nematophilum]
MPLPAPSNGLPRPIKLACLSWYVIIQGIQKNAGAITHIIAAELHALAATAYNLAPARGRDCIYQPSRRGGARVRKKSRAQEDPSKEMLATAAGATATEQIPQHRHPAIDVRGLSEDTDAIFDTLFSQAMLGNAAGQDMAFDSPPRFPPLSVPSVRTYGSDGAILEAYYVFIHPYFPILPPPTRIPQDQAIPRYHNCTGSFECESESSTAIGLAISAVLALIPCTGDADHAAEDSVLLRRNYAQYLAQCALESIEIECEIPESSINPSKALAEAPRHVLRRPFHPKVPVELESIIALDILSIYEYAQRGNLKKMQGRAGQALVAAMSLSLHLRGEDDEPDEARRRVWWMTYVCVCQAAIAGNTEPSAFAVFIPSFTCEYPTLKSDGEVTYDILIHSTAQQAILATAQFAMELDKAIKSNGDMGRIYERMRDLDSHLESLNKMADSWTLQSTTISPVDPSEAVVSRALRCMSRIKLSRPCDPSFQSEAEDTVSEPRYLASNSSDTAAAESPFLGASSSSLSSSPESGRPDAALFSSHQSAKICLKSALTIAQSFEDMPYPNPSGQQGPWSPSPMACPRTMPSLACCALQGAHALAMVGKKTRSKYSGDALADPMVECFLARLDTGLRSISAILENYATVFEAIGGMPGKEEQGSCVGPERYES